MRRSSALLPLLLAPLLAACPGPGNDSTGTEGMTSTTTSTGTEGMTSTSAGTESPTSTTDGTTGAVCELPANDEPGASTATITIRNDSAAAVYVLPKSQFSCNYALIEIDIDGANVHWDHPGVYPYPCDEGRCQWGCSDGGSNGLIINPGAAAEVPWNGGVWAKEALSEACLAEFGCPESGPECEARRVQGEVAYTARVHVTDTCPGEMDVCDACVAGVCELFVYEPNWIDTVQSYEASAAFPAGAEIVIQ